MLVQSVMMREVVHVESDVLVSEAAAMMKEKGIRCLIVTTDHNVKGVITDSDIIFRVVGKGQDPTKVKVGEIMTKDPATISPDVDIFDAVRLMEERRIRRLPVVDNSGKLVGILSIGDVAANLMVRMEILRSSTPKQ